MFGFNNRNYNLNKDKWNCFTLFTNSSFILRYLPSVRKQEGEEVEHFAKRTQELIASTLDLTITNFLLSDKVIWILVLSGFKFSFVFFFLLLWFSFIFFFVFFSMIDGAAITMIDAQCDLINSYLSLFIFTLW